MENAIPFEDGANLVPSQVDPLIVYQLDCPARNAWRGMFIGDIDDKSARHVPRNAS